MTSTIIPTLRYRDAKAMIVWLCDAFGFQRHLVVEDQTGGIAHAQLRLGNAMIMLGSARDDALGKLMSTAENLDGVSQSAYIVVDDVDAICERARDLGAEIVMGPQDEDYGGRGFSCRDPEKQLWNFGTYNPWDAQ